MCAMRLLFCSDSLIFSLDMQKMTHWHVFFCPKIWLVSIFPLSLRHHNKYHNQFYKKNKYNGKNTGFTEAMHHPARSGR